MTTAKHNSLLHRSLKVLYSIGLKGYHGILYLASLFHPKAKKWVAGRRGWQKVLEQACAESDKWIWFHVASLGEFEQGRNLMEALKSAYPEYKLLISFFSPSGYEIRKNYGHASHVTYLPLDHAQNAKAFLDILNPRLVVFVKYELWLNYLKEVRTQNIPAILISASVTEKSKFLTSIFAPLYREAFLSFTAIFTQEQRSVDLLRGFTDHPKVIESSDTRFDRVLANREQFQPLAEIERFVAGRRCIVGGSTWPKGEKILMEAMVQLADIEDLCWIIAPHEIHAGRIQQAIQQMPEESLRYSELQSMKTRHRVLWIDNIGMLSRIYHYATVAYIGGGFHGGLHNVLEAVTFGCPVLFGPKHHNRPEAAQLISSGGGQAISSADEMVHALRARLSDPAKLARLTEHNRRFITTAAGATQQIVDFCVEQGFLSED